MHITIQRIADNATQVRETLAKLVLSQINSHAGHVYGLERVKVEIASDKILEISLAYSLDHENMSFVVFYNGTHVFTAGCGCNLKSPYFAFLTYDRDWLEFFFELKK